MFDKLKALFQDTKAATDAPVTCDALQLATAALLIEAAQLDGQFSDAEAAKISTLLQKKFNLDTPTTAQLMAQAEVKSDHSIQIFGFTRTIAEQCSPEERTEIMELLWSVAYADGELHPYESNLMRRIAGLLHVSDSDSGAAKKRARAETL